MSSKIIEEKRDPATYRLIEILFGRAIASDGIEKEFQVPWVPYVYIGGPDLCTAKPEDYRPSNDKILADIAQYEGDGFVRGSITLGSAFAMTEAGLLLKAPDTTIVVAKTCFDRVINLYEGQIVDIVIRFIL